MIRTAPPPCRPTLLLAIYRTPYLLARVDARTLGVKRQASLVVDAESSPHLPSNISDKQPGRDMATERSGGVQYHVFFQYHIPLYNISTAVGLQ